MKRRFGVSDFKAKKNIVATSQVLGRGELREFQTKFEAEVERRFKDSANRHSSRAQIEADVRRDFERDRPDLKAMARTELRKHARDVDLMLGDARAWLSSYRRVALPDPPLHRYATKPFCEPIHGLIYAALMRAEQRAALQDLMNEVGNLGRHELLAEIVRRVPAIEHDQAILERWPNKAEAIDAVFDHEQRLHQARLEVFALQQAFLRPHPIDMTQSADRILAAQQEEQNWPARLEEALAPLLPQAVRDEAAELATAIAELEAQWAVSAMQLRTIEKHGDPIAEMTPAQVA